MSATTMANHSLHFKRSVPKNLSAITNADVRRILLRIAGPQVEPRLRGCEKLTGSKRYRIRRSTYDFLGAIQRWLVIVVRWRTANRLTGRRA